MIESSLWTTVRFEEIFKEKIQRKLTKIFLSSKRQDKRKYINVEDILDRISYYFKKYEKVA